MSDKKILVGDMSRETAIGILKLMLEAMGVYDGISPTPERINAVKMATDSLEKLEKIEQIISKPLSPLNYESYFDQIKEVLEHE